MVSKVLKNFLFYSLMIVSITTFINIVVLYWFPINIPTALYLPVSLMMTSYFFEIYYLIPISFLICFIVIFTAFSILKERLISPMNLLLLLLFEMILLGVSFFNAWLIDEHFIFIQMIQLIVDIVVVINLSTYCFLVLKKKRRLPLENK